MISVEPYVCVDVDGVLLDLQSHLSLWLKNEYGVNFNPDELKYYSYRRNDLGFDSKLIYDTLKNEEFYRHIDFFPDALDALKELQSFIHTKAYTGSVAVPSVLDIRRSLCEKLGLYGEPFYGLKKTTDFGAVALFDDCLEVHEQWLMDDAKTTFFLIDAPYNRECEFEDSIIRCSSFAEAVTKFKEMYKG